MTHFLFKIMIKVKMQTSTTEKIRKRLHKNVNN